MKKILVEDKFVDFKGVERPFVVCGMIQSLDESWSDYYDIKETGREVKVSPTAILSIGLSVCHESDLSKVNPEMGKKLAEGRAEKARDSASVLMLIDNYKFATNKLLQRIVNEFVADFKYAPGKYIKGYNESEVKYCKKNQEAKQ